MKLNQTLRKYLLSGILCVLLVLSYFPLETSAFDQSNAQLDEDAASEIALTYPEITAWLLDKEITDQRVRYYTTGFWEIDLTTSDGINSIQVRVVVNDVKQSVISISYTDLSNEEAEQTAIENQAFDFFKSDPISKDFTDNNFDIETSLEGKNIVFVKGENYSKSYKRLKFSAQISYNSTISGEYEFGFIQINANFIFGNLTTSVDEIKEIVEANDVFEDFILEYPFSPNNSYRYIEAILYFDSPYLNHQPGYVYDIHYHERNSYRINYVDNEFIINPDDHYDFRDAISRIQILDDIFIEAEIDPLTLNFTNVWGSFLLKDNITNFLDAVLLNETHKQWIKDISPFLGDIAVLQNKNVIVTLESRISSDYGKFTVNSTSLKILEQNVIKSNPAQMSSNSVYFLAIQDQQIIDFRASNEYMSHSILFDTVSTWRVEFYNPFIEENTAQVYINDTSREIIEVTINKLESDPKLSINSIINLALATDYYMHYKEFRDSRLSLYLSHDYWIANIYSPLFPQNSYKIQIDDTTGELVSETRMNFGTGNSTSKEQFLKKVEESPELLDFRQNYPDAYETIIFDDEWIFYTEYIHSQIIIDQLIIEDTGGKLDIISKSTIAGSEFIQMYDFVLDDREFNTFIHPRNSVYRGGGGIGNARVYDKLVTFALSDLLDGEINFGDTLWTLNREDNNDDDNNGSPLLMIFGLVGGVYVAIVLVIRYRRGVE